MKEEQILKRPVITEKSLAAASLGKYTFAVSGKAKKGEIAKAIEKTFGVHVVSVKTVNLKGKKRRVGPRRRIVATSFLTKAIVELLPGEKIDLFTVPGQEEAKK